MEVRSWARNTESPGGTVILSVQAVRQENCKSIAGHESLPLEPSYQHLPWYCGTRPVAYGPRHPPSALLRGLLGNVVLVRLFRLASQPG